MKSGKVCKILIALCLALCLAASGALPAGLSYPVTAQAAAKAVKLNKTKATIYNSQTLQLKLANAKGRITWKSSNKKIASVTSKGKVKALKPGTATITATNAGKNYTCKVTVKSVLAVRKSSVTIRTGKRTAVDFWFYVPGNFNWKVANPEMLLCEWSEKWTGGGNRSKLYLTGLKAGTTTVKLTNNKTRDTVTIKVKIKGKTVSPVSASTTNLEMKTGDVTTVTITSLGDSELTVESSDEDVVYCEWGDWNGNTIPLELYAREGGDSTLTVTHDDTGATLQIYVFVEDETIYD